MSWVNIVQENKEVVKLLRPKWTKYIPITPTPKQQAFLLLMCEEAFYGGAAGGGKSIALLAAALQFVDHSNYDAILMRDTYANLSKPNALMDVSFKWLYNTDAHWDGEKKRWKFPSNATLSFGYLDGPNDHFNYQGPEYQFVGIDEITNIRENQARYMFSRLRKNDGSPIPIRFRAASNPPAREQVERGEWVKSRYVDPYLRDKDIIFIPAWSNDNPHLDQDAYAKSLSKLDPITRKQLEEGDWDVNAKGEMFERHWFQIVDVMPANTLETVRYWDLAATELDPKKHKTEGQHPAFTAGCKMSKTKDGLYYIQSIVRAQHKPKSVEALVRQTADLDGKRIPIWMEQEPGSSGVNTIDHYRRMILPEFNFREDKVSGSKVERAMPLASQADAGNVFLVKGEWNEPFLKEIELFPIGKFKDQVDVASGAFDKLAHHGVQVRIRTV